MDSLVIEIFFHRNHIVAITLSLGAFKDIYFTEFFDIKTAVSFVVIFTVVLR